MSKLYFTYGAMNCGKSTSLLQVAHNYEERGMRVLVMKPSIDTKGDKSVVSRIGTRRDADLLVTGNDNLTHVIRAWQDANGDVSCILIDEAQFLDPTQAEQLFHIAHTDDIPVMCYGLRTDFKVVGFPGSTRLLEIADDIRELRTICECGKKATTNVRLVNGIPTQTGEQVAIDGKDDVEYVSVCADCFMKMFPDAI